MVWILLAWGGKRQAATDLLGMWLPDDRAPEYGAWVVGSGCTGDQHCRCTMPRGAMCPTAGMGRNRPPITPPAVTGSGPRGSTSSLRCGDRPIGWIETCGNRDTRASRRPLHRRGGRPGERGPRRGLLVGIMIVEPHDSIPSHVQPDRGGREYRPTLTRSVPGFAGSGTPRCS